MSGKKYGSEDESRIIREAVDGDKKSLEELIKKHQDFIYNIALRFFLDPDDAMDATQEVLIKVITSLKTYRGESQFRTWLYRIAINHFLNTTKRKYELLLEAKPSYFAGFSSSNSAEEQITEAEIEEVRLLCSTAMLMCLNREQRLLYIIGEIFGADHNLGAELFDISPANYRVKLHRAKIDLLNFVSGKCGIINPENPCRCPKKTRSLIEMGVVDKFDLKFNSNFTRKINELVADRKNEISDRIQLEMSELFRDSPFQIKKEIDQLLSSILK
jgi:RNA polymerase sigma factor (sigma-70 family)